jgi:hypothetical protein
MEKEIKKLKEDYEKAADINKRILEEIEARELECNRAQRELQGRALITMYLKGELHKQTICIGGFMKEVLWSHPSKFAI